SEKLPPPEEAQLSELTAQTLPKGGGGQIKFVGHVDKSDRIGQLEDALRDKQHNVSGKGTAEDPERQGLPWSLDETVIVAAPSESASGGPPSTAAAKSPATTVGGTAGLPSSDGSTGAQATRATRNPKQGGAK